MREEKIGFLPVTDVKIDPLLLQVYREGITRPLPASTEWQRDIVFPIGRDHRLLGFYQEFRHLAAEGIREIPVIRVRFTTADEAAIYVLSGETYIPDTTEEMIRKYGLIREIETFRAHHRQRVAAEKTNRFRQPRYNIRGQLIDDAPVAAIEMSDRGAARERAARYFTLGPTTLENGLQVIETVDYLREIGEESERERLRHLLNSKSIHNAFAEMKAHGSAYIGVLRPNISTLFRFAGWFWEPVIACSTGRYTRYKLRDTHLKGLAHACSTLVPSNLLRDRFVIVSPTVDLGTRNISKGILTELLQAVARVKGLEFIIPTDAPEQLRRKAESWPRNCWIGTVVTSFLRMRWVEDWLAQVKGVKRMMIVRPVEEFDFSVGYPTEMARFVNVKGETQIKEITERPLCEWIVAEYPISDEGEMLPATPTSVMEAFLYANRAGIRFWGAAEIMPGDELPQEYPALSSSPPLRRSIIP